MGKGRWKLRNSILVCTIKLIFKRGLSLLIGQGVILFFFLLTLTPILNRIYYALLHATGYSYVTVDNIRSFLLNPLSLVIIFLLIIIIGVYLLYEIYFLITFYSMIEDNNKLRTYKICLLALRRMFLFLKKGGLRLIPTVWLNFIVFNLPLFGLAFFRIRILKYFTGVISGRGPFIIIGLFVLYLIATLLFRRAFIFHYSLTEGQSYKGILKKSRNTEKNRPYRTLLYFILWNTLVSTVIFFIYAFAMALITLFTAGIPDRSLAIATFISVNDSMNGYLLTITFVICTISNFALNTHLFYHYRLAPESKERDYTSPEELLSWRKGDGSKYRKIIEYAFILLVVLNLYFYFNIIRNGSPLTYMNLDTIQITSHRGFSRDIPENTIPAIEKAIQEQADYVEVDVRVTKDGELVLLHDPSLRRTTGLNQYIWDVDYATVATLDAGGWMGEGFRGIKIPTLREVFEICKGKVILNLELKYRGADEGLVEKTVDLIKEYDMEWQCVISSTSLACLEKIKEIDPDLQTGYIIHQLYSGLSLNKSIDFFSMKSSLISKTDVELIHKNGKKLFVWTVNNRPEIERLKRLGVDNIITDDPTYTREVLERPDSNQYFLTLLRVIRD